MIKHILYEFQEFNSELSYTKNPQEVSKSYLPVDLPAVKIRLTHFLGMFHVRQLRIKLWKFVKWVFMIFPLPEIEGFFGINTDLPINHKWIPYSRTLANSEFPVECPGLAVPLTLMKQC